MKIIGHEMDGRMTDRKLWFYNAAAWIHGGHMVQSGQSISDGNIAALQSQMTWNANHSTNQTLINNTATRQSIPEGEGNDLKLTTLAIVGLILAHQVAKYETTRATQQEGQCWNDARSDAAPENRWLFIDEELIGRGVGSLARGADNISPEGQQWGSDTLDVLGDAHSWIAEQVGGYQRLEEIGILAAIIGAAGVAYRGAVNSATTAGRLNNVAPSQIPSGSVFDNAGIINITTGNSIPNGRAPFNMNAAQSELLNAGFAKRVSADGRAIIFTRGSETYVIRPSNTGPTTMDFRINGREQSRIRLSD